MATPEERSAAASEQMSIAMANLVTTLTAQQAAADKKARDEEKREAALKETTDMMAEALKENIKFDEDKAKEEKKKVVERKLLGQSEKQYEATLAQRKVAEDAKKELDDMKEILGDSAESNEKYQKAKAKFDKAEAKARKLEGRRNLLSRFKETKGEAGTGAAVKELGGTALKGIGKTFKKIGGFVGQFSKIFSILVIPALVLLVNSPAWGMLKEGIKNLIDYLSADDNFLFGKNGVIKELRDKFGDLEVGTAGILGLLTLKALGFGGIKKILVGLKKAVVFLFSPKGAFLKLKGLFLFLKGVFIKVGAILLKLKAVALSPFVAIVAAFAAVGYAIYDTFVEVRKKFLEGAGVGELIQTAIVNFVGAFGKILDFAKNLLADVLEFFGFEDIAKKFREFSFEKIIEDGLNKVFDFFKKILDFDFMGFIKEIPGAKKLMKMLGIDTTEKPKLTPEEKASQEISEQEGKELVNPIIAKQRKLEEARALANLPFRQATARITASLNAQKRRLAAAQKDVDTEGKGGFKFLKESEEEKRADDLRLFNEKQRLEMIKEELAALEGQRAKAQAAVNISAPTVNTVNEAPKTENNVTSSSSLKGFGTVGALSAGMGTMASGIGE